MLVRGVDFVQGRGHGRGREPCSCSWGVTERCGVSADLECWVSEVHRFASFARAEVAAVGESPGGGDGGQSLWWWREVYGRSRIEADTLDDVMAEVAAMLEATLQGASAVAVHLAMQVAQLRHQSVLDVLDEVEWEITEQLGGLD